MEQVSQGSMWQQDYQDSLPRRNMDFSLFHYIQTGFGLHSLYQTGGRGSTFFFRDKV
jgi:hypothetical protein